MKPLFNKDRVESAATFIAAELKTLLDRSNIKSDLQRRISKACPPQLTIGEQVLATLRALAIVQLEVAADMASLLRESPWYDDEDEAA